ncbi:uncharacterized protein LOC135343221 isoform X2 [Halichondria panicea]|uniref:uncharacterized protein LOC135343221 isoform X2 n=1 Tax=Halichondria panicea TaxID=6063 RepID=UPI00312B6261
MDFSNQLSSASATTAGKISTMEYPGRMWSVSIRFMGQELTPGISQVCLSHIGEQLSRANASDGPDTVEGTALVCVTNNPNCCRPVDHPNTGAVGEWTINGFTAPRMNAKPLARVYSNRGTGLVRINYRPSVEGMSVTGQYCCTIPDMSGVFQILCVEVNNDTMCNLSVSTTTNQLPLTTTSNDGTTTLITTGPPDTTTLIVNPTTDGNQLPPVTASANESPATFILAGIVAISGLLNLLLIILVILLFYKYKRAKQSHDVMGTHDIVQAIATDIDLSDNQAYGKAREAPDKAMPQEAGQTTELYDYIPNTLFQGHPPGAQTSAMDNSEGVVSSEVYQEMS